MKYFLHDTNSFDDEKITELYIKFGYEGLGLFYTLLEKIAKQEKPVKTSVLKTQLKVKKRLEKCWCFMDEIGLISSNNGETFNEKLLNYSEMYQIKKEKTRKKVQEWREKQADRECVTDYVPVSNLPKVKESKVNKNKDNKIYSEFVSMLPDEYEKLIQKYGEPNTLKFIEKLNNYKGAKGVKYKSDYLAILNWVVKEVLKEQKLQSAPDPKMSRKYIRDEQNV